MSKMPIAGAFTTGAAVAVETRRGDRGFGGLSGPPNSIADLDLGGELHRDVDREDAVEVELAVVAVDGVVRELVFGAGVVEASRVPGEGQPAPLDAEAEEVERVEVEP